MSGKTVRFVALAIVAAMLLIVFPGCQKQETTKGNELTAPVEITFWNGWTGPDRPLLEQLVKFYNDNNKDKVTVKMDIMEHQALAEKMAAALASNTAPNLHLADVVSDYGVHGQYVAIDDIFEKTALKKDDFIESIFSEMYYNGHLYGIPFQLSSLFMYWNKDLFKAAGLDPEKPPATWEDIQPMALKINDPSKNILGGGFNYNDSMCWGVMAQSYGGMFIEGDTVADLKVVVTDPKYYDANLKSIKVIKALVDSGCVTCQDGSQNGAAFQAGTMGMRITIGCDIPAYKSAGINFGLSLLPAGPKGIKEPGFPIAMVVMKGTSGDKLLATYKFIEYWHNNLSNWSADKQKSPAYQWSQAQGYQPYLKSVANDATLMSDPLVKITCSYVNYYTKWLPKCFWNFFAVGFMIVPGVMEGVMTNKTTPEQGLADLQKQLQDLVTQMQSE
jgi:multiple sugar transport system substrate-binding protein